MEWNRVETLLNADVDKVAAKASNSGAALAALGNRIRAEVGAVEAAMTALQERLDELPVKARDARALADRCDAIIVKAEGDGREDLAAAARARKEAAIANATALAGELTQGEDELTRLEDALTRLEEKAADIDARLPEGGLGEPPADLPADVAPLPRVPAISPAAPTPAAASGGGDDLDAQFADLLAGMGDLDDAPRAAASADDDDDDDLALPDLVEIGADELPEGADPDSTDPIDFSAIDALAARESGKPVPRGKAAAPAKGKAGLPAVKEKNLPAVTPKPGLPATTDGAPPKSKKTMGIVVGGAIVVAGTIATLLALGVL